MEWDVVTELPPGVAEHLGYYVYLYVDPRTDKPFYVGKGVGNRILAHFGDVRDSKKSKLITELKSAGISPRLEVLAHGLKDEETAFRIEAAVIDALDLKQLTNEVRGWRSLETGRMTLDELAGFYAAKPVEISHRVLLIRVNKLYRFGIEKDELYEATRGIWRLGERREQVEYAFATFHGVVREVYQVKAWHPACTLEYKTRQFSEAASESKRWEFEGEIAPAAVRELYCGKSVHQYLRHGNQSPTVYINC